jgi:hypothetical protein
MGPASQLVRAGQIGNLAMPHLVLSAAMPLPKHASSVRFVTAVGDRVARSLCELASVLVILHVSPTVLKTALAYGQPARQERFASTELRAAAMGMATQNH